MKVIIYKCIFNLHDCAFNDTQTEKLCFIQFSTRMASWLLLTRFVKYIVKNEWLLLPASFTGKFGLVFVLTLENVFSLRFHLKANRKNIGSSKNGSMDFLNDPPFERWACFYVTISENFKRFQYFNFETNFLENQNLFQKTGVPFFSWKH